MQAYRVTFRDGFSMPVNANSALDAMLRARVWARTTARVNRWAIGKSKIPFRQIRERLTPQCAVPMVPSGWESV